MANTAINDLTYPELRAKDTELRLELFNLRLQQATARLEKPHRIRELRKDIARSQTRLTVLRKQHKQAKTAAPKA